MIMMNPMQKIGVLGTGMVGNTIASRLIGLDYEVKMGSRTAGNDKAKKWAESNGPKASQGTFSDASRFADMIFNCTKGEHTLDVLQMAEAENMSGKILIDVSVPLDFSTGSPPTLIPALTNTNSLGEEIQRRFPKTLVVKTLNIVNCEVMVDPSKCGGDGTMFIAGNKSEAKKEVEKILQKFGWKDIIDLGEIRHSRSTEMMLPIWLSVRMTNKNNHFGFKIVR
jgi:8-hydroxy-5-deazaflavin:NADPH oxidoreductase